MVSTVTRFKDVILILARGVCIHGEGSSIQWFQIFIGRVNSSSLNEEANKQADAKP